MADRRVTRQNRGTNELWPTPSSPRSERKRFWHSGLNSAKAPPKSMFTRRLSLNAGKDGSIITGKLVESSDYTWGYDAQTDEFCDLMAKGIIDPTKVVRCALQDAASIASLLITTEAMIAEKPKKVEGDGHMHPGIGAGMDY
jgi:TCP-1/cpn60 chaperonin family